MYKMNLPGPRILSAEPGALKAKTWGGRSVHQGGGNRDQQRHPEHQQNQQQQ